MQALPRGLRNNNPLNIRLSSIQWVGQVPPEKQTDSDFCQFVDIFHGCRAAIVNVRTHIEHDRHRLIRTTIQREISRWAPASENDTEAYIAYVERNMQMPRTTVLKFSDKHTLCSMLYWMARYENGSAADIHYFWFERAYEIMNDGTKIV